MLVSSIGDGRDFVSLCLLIVLRIKYQIFKCSLGYL